MNGHGPSTPMKRPAFALILVLLGWPLGLWGGDFARIWPALAAIVLVLVLKDALVALLLGGLSGALVLHAAQPWQALPEFATRHIVGSFKSEWNVSALLFTLLMGGLIAVVEAGGGIRALAARFLGAPGAASARRVQGAAFGLGLACFFDGLANSMLVGRVFRPLFDRARVSRAMLAYIVDSTSAPVACLAFISTWIAFQLSLIRDGFAAVGRTANPYEIFLQSVPTNYYCWFTLLLVGIVVWRGWQIGPMRHAAVFSAPADGVADAGPQPSIWRGALPIVFLIGAILGGLYLDGAADPWPFSLRKAADAFGAADAAQVLLVSSVLACLLAVFLHRRRTGEPSAGAVFGAGMRDFLLPASILIGAWGLGSVMKELEAAAWLAGALHGNLPLWSLPALVFLLGSLISFCTGTSWGTMGVLMPLALPATLTLSAGLPEAESAALAAGVVGAVFSGAVFGDHCSPLSDTTIVAAISSGIETLEHTRTQLPYALLAAGTALVLGFLPDGLGLHPAAGLIAGAVFLLVLPSIWKPGR